MFKILGIEDVKFTTKDGIDISGKSIYYGAPIEKNGKGYKCDRFFLSENKMNRLNFVPDIGDTVQLMYNRYGKVDSLIKTSIEDGDIDFG